MPDDPEIIDPGDVGPETTTLARVGDQNEAGAAFHAAIQATVKAEAGKIAAQMETRWLEEKQELNRQTKEDEDRQLRMLYRDVRYRMVERVASAVVSEGAVGTKYSPKQISDYATKIAYAVIDRVRDDELKDLKRRGVCCPLCNRPIGDDDVGKGK